MLGEIMWIDNGKKADFQNIIYMVCFNCGRVTATDTGYCRHCKAPLFVSGSLPPPPDALDYDLEVGESCGKPVGLKLDDIKRHVGVFGLTGFGKTTFVKKVLLELYRKKVPFTVFDWEGEYRDVAEGLGTEYFCIPSKDFSFNPFDNGNIPVDDYASWLSSLLTEVYVESFPVDKPFSPRMVYVLNKAVLDVVRSKGNFKDLLHYFSKYCKDLPAGRSTMLALYNRFHRLALGSLSSIWSKTSTIRDFSSRSIIFDISRLARFSILDARFFVLLALQKIFDEALSRGFSSKLKHVTVIEEVEEVSGKFFRLRRTWTPLRFLLRMRKRGEGMILVSHSPSLVDFGLIKSVGTLVCFRLQDMEDAKNVAGFLGLYGEGWRLIPSLKIGEAIVKTSSTPFKVNVSKPVFPRLSSLERRFLQNIIEEPFLSIRERRLKLGISGRRYSEIERKLIFLGHIKPVSVYIGLGRPIKLYEIRGGGESIAHRFGIEYCKKVLEKHGLRYRVSRRPDIIILDYNVAVEVETGRNIVKGKFTSLLEEFNKVLVVTLDKNLLDKLKRKNSDRINIVSLAEFEKHIPRLKTKATPQTKYTTVN